MKRFTAIVLVLALAASLSFSVSCSRQPSVERAHNIMEGYFKKYQKKYPNSILGQYPVEDIKILHIEEVHKGLVAVYAILELNNGMALQTRFSIQKKPLGWRRSSWENMGMAVRKPAN